MKATHHPPILDTGMTPADLLRGAALYLQRHGWTQHEFFDLLAATGGPFPPACTSGAIMTGATGRCLAERMCTFDGDEDPETEAAVRAMRVFAAYIEPDYDTWSTSAIDIIGDWNDYDGRTLDEVMECLHDAADEWQAAQPTGGAR